MEVNEFEGDVYSPAAVPTLVSLCRSSCGSSLLTLAVHSSPDKPAIIQRHLSNSAV